MLRQVPATAPPTEKELANLPAYEPKPGGLLGLLAALGLVVFSVALLLANPLKPLDLEINSQNVEQYQQQGFYGLETDAAGNQFRWTNGRATLRVELRARQTVILTVRARNAVVAQGPNEDTQLRVNEVPVGLLSRQLVDGGKFIEYKTEFKPFYVDALDETIQIDLFTPSFVPPGDGRKLGLMVQNIRLDTSPSWQPYFSRAGFLDTVLWVSVAAGLAGLFLLTQRNLRRAGTMLAVAGSSLIIGVLLARLVLLARVGYPGPHPEVRQTYWFFFSGNGLLALALGWLIVTRLPLRNNKTGWEGLKSFARAKPLPAWVARRNMLALLTYFFAVNLALMLVIYAQQYIVYGTLDNLGRHWDGPRYYINAVTLYDQSHPMLLVPTHPKLYWITAFPAVPLLIRALSYLTGTLAAGLVINLFIVPLVGLVLYRLLRDFNYATRPLWLSTLALVLPVRWLSNRVIPSVETLTMLGCLGAFYFFKKERYGWAGVMGAIAVAARPNAVSLWAGLLLALVLAIVADKFYPSYRERHRTTPPPQNELAALARLAQTEGKIWLGYAWQTVRLVWLPILKISFMLVVLVVIYAFYGWRAADWLIYFKVQEFTVNKEFPASPVPFAVLFNGLEGNNSLLGVFFDYLLPLVGAVILWRQGRARLDLLCVGLLLYLPLSFLQHADMPRFMLPVFPFLVLIPFARWLERPRLGWFWLIFLLMVYFNTFNNLGHTLADHEQWQGMKAFFR